MQPEMLFIKIDASGNPAWSRHLLVHQAIEVDPPWISGEPSGGMILLSNDPLLDLGSGPVLNGSPGVVLAKLAP